MLEERAVVVEVFDQRAVIQIKPSNRCGQCAATHCGTTDLTAKPVLVKVINHQGAMVGDEVIIGLEEKALLKSAVAIYLLPLLGMFAFAIGYRLLAVTTPLPDYEILTVLASLIGLVVGLKFAQRALLKQSTLHELEFTEKRSQRKDTGSQPVILKTLKTPANSVSH